MGTSASSFPVSNINSDIAVVDVVIVAADVIVVLRGNEITDRTLIRAEEGPKVLAHPLQLIWLKQIFHLLWQITP